MAKQTGNRIGILRKANKFLILNCIIKYAPVTIEEVIKKTDISRPTVVKMVNELMESGYVTKSGSHVSTGGRAPALFQPSFQSWFAVGVDLEFPAVRFAVADMSGTMLAEETVLFALNAKPEDVKQSVYEHIKKVIADSRVDPGQIIGIGIGLSGLVDVKNGISRSIERIAGWKNVDLKSFLASKDLDLPIYIANDVHLLGFVEKKLYLESCCNDFIYIGLRSGIGSLIVKDGKMWEGEYGNAGFIGHMTINTEGPVCRCGSRGCLDVYSGQLALSEAYDANKEGSSLHPDLGTLIALSANGDEVASKLLGQAGYHLGVALANMVKVVEISQIVIGACEGFEGSPYYTELHHGMKDFFTVDCGYDISLRCGQLTEREYPLGGCFFAFAHMFEKPKLSLSV